MFNLEEIIQEQKAKRYE